MIVGKAPLQELKLNLKTDLASSQAPSPVDHMACLIPSIVRLITGNAVHFYSFLTGADATWLPVEHNLTEDYVMATTITTQIRRDSEETPLQDWNLHLNKDLAIIQAPSP